MPVLYDSPALEYYMGDIAIIAWGCNGGEGINVKVHCDPSVFVRTPYTSCSLPFRANLDNLESNFIPTTLVVPHDVLPSLSLSQK